MGLLDGDITALFGGVFGSFFHDGTLTNNTGAPIYDGARITGYTPAAPVAVKVQVTDATTAMQREKGYAEGDRAVIVLAEGAGILTDDMVIEVERDGAAGTESYRLQSVSLDSAQSHWVCRGRKLSGS